MHSLTTVFLVLVHSDYIHSRYIICVILFIATLNSPSKDFGICSSVLFMGNSVGTIGSLRVSTSEIIIVVWGVHSIIFICLHRLLVLYFSISMSISLWLFNRRRIGFDDWHLDFTLLDRSIGPRAWNDSPLTMFQFQVFKFRTSMIIFKRRVLRRGAFIYMTWKTVPCSGSYEKERTVANCLLESRTFPWTFRPEKCK